MTFCYRWTGGVKEKFIGVKAFNISNKKLIWEDSGSAYTSVYYSPSGAKIAFGSHDNIVIDDAINKFKKKAIKTPDFNWTGFLGDNHILIFEKGETTVHGIDVGKVDGDEYSKRCSFHQLVQHTSNTQCMHHSQNRHVCTLCRRIHWLLLHHQ